VVQVSKKVLTETKNLKEVSAQGSKQDVFEGAKTTALTTVGKKSFFKLEFINLKNF
jgi:hypothetical protein